MSISIIGNCYAICFSCSRTLNCSMPDTSSMRLTASFSQRVRSVTPKYHRAKQRVIHPKLYGIRKLTHWLRNVKISLIREVRGLSPIKGASDTPKSASGSMRLTSLFHTLKIWFLKSIKNQLPHRLQKQLKKLFKKVMYLSSVWHKK